MFHLTPAECARLDEHQKGVEASAAASILATARSKTSPYEIDTIPSSSGSASANTCRTAFPNSVSGASVPFDRDGSGVGRSLPRPAPSYSTRAR